MLKQNIIKWLKLNLPWMARLSRETIHLGSRIKAKTWPDKSIVFYSGSTSEEWTPESLKIGIGGSQGDVIYLAREWVKLGYKVTVYNNCGAKEGTYDGVEYLNYHKFNKYDVFDTLIVWRHPWRVSFPIKAKRIWLDLHDVPDHQQFTEERLKHYHKILVCSQYHRSLLPPHVPEDKIVIISNGFDQSYLKYSRNKKDPYKLIYASRYYRGLEHMLMHGWPIIKKEVPQAELHIYHDWTALENKPERANWKQKMIELMKQPGVTEHGRIGREEIMQVKSTTAIHYYGCSFEEIDCNTIRESAVVGCVPATTDYAVFKEKPYCVKVSGNPYAKETQEELAYKIVDLLKNQEELEQIREHFQQSSKTETWDNIAKQWLEVK